MSMRLIFLSEKEQRSSNWFRSPMHLEGKIEKREIKSLIKAGDELKCKNLEIITWDYEDEINLDGKTIKCMPLWKWLLHG